jgi:hypothetical protein
VALRRPCFISTAVWSFGLVAVMKEVAAVNAKVTLPQLIIGGSFKLVGASGKVTT